MEFQVSEVCQSASGASYIAKYHAEVKTTWTPGSVVVEVISTIPEDPDRELLRQAVESIRRGAETVLAPRNQGATLKVQRLVIHDVDCKPIRFQTATAKALARALATQ